MILEEILETKEEEVRELRRRGEAVLLRQLEDAPPARSFRGALSGGRRLSVIAEFKRRSPSAGELAPAADPVEVGEAYRHAGASALSVLTDEAYFGGGLEDLRAARQASGLAALRKDFVLDPLQLLEARSAGADAVLLIVRALEPSRLRDLLSTAEELGLDALVEVHGEGELETALDAGAGVVGVNARDLSTFEVDLSRCEELVRRIPPDRVAVAESGVSGPEDAARMGRAGADAVLVGSALMRAGPEELLPRLAGVERTARGANA